ncbi:Uncharacterised protein [Vibrio cholerae]|nr:Uncharacterised protein [Vibrio cholerae]
MQHAKWLMCEMAHRHSGGNAIFCHFSVNDI